MKRVFLQKKISQIDFRSDPELDPDPLSQETDSRIQIHQKNETDPRIRIKMKRIRNTGKMTEIVLFAVKLLHISWLMIN